MRCTVRLCCAFAAVLVIPALMSCSNQLDPGDGSAARTLPNPVSAKALSSHYVKVQFEAAVDASALSGDAFRISSTDGAARLSVFQAELAPDGRTVLLVTDPQEPRAYQLTTSGTTAAGADAQFAGVLFNGSTTGEPQLLSAVSLNSTTVLLSFTDVMNAVTAEVAAFYHIADPDGLPDVDISVTAAQLGPDGTTVMLTTTPQENREYTVHVSNIDAAYHSSFACLGDEYVLNVPFSTCAQQIRPTDASGIGAPFVLTARTKIDHNAPLDPNAAGSPAHVYFTTVGAGVLSTTCLGGQTITGNGSERDEELIITFDVPFQHEAITLRQTDFTFVSDDPVYFVSSDAQAGYDFVVPEAELVPAFASSGVGSGAIYLGDIATLPSGVLIDSVKIRETAFGTLLSSVCIAAPRRLDPTTSDATFFGIPPVDNVPPVVLSAVPTSNTSLLVSFSEPLREGAANPLNFLVSPELVITGRKPSTSARRSSSPRFRCVLVCPTH